MFFEWLKFVHQYKTLSGYYIFKISVKNLLFETYVFPQVLRRLEATIMSLRNWSSGRFYVIFNCNLSTS
jgi:hypothetical protein